MRNRKGFTLMEMVGVLIIMALIAAITAPGIFGYIDDMSKRSSINAARMAVSSAQTELTDVYQSGKSILSGKKKEKWLKRMEYDSSKKLWISCLSGSADNMKRAFTIDKALYSDGKVFVYYDSGEYKVLDSNTMAVSGWIDMTDTSTDNKLIDI